MLGLYCIVHPFSHPYHFLFAPVFKLVTEDRKGSSTTDVDDISNKFLYSLAVSSEGSAAAAAEPISTAHERDMACFRDMLQDKSNILTNNLVRNQNTWDSIAPADPVREVILRNVSSSQEDTVMEDARATASSTTVKYSRGPKKVTTANSFFADKKAAKVSSTGSRKETAGVKASKASSSVGSKPVSKTKGGACINATTGANKGHDEEKENQSKDRSELNQKQKQRQTPNSSKKESFGKSGSKTVGNADDFVGDLDDDDDDDDDVMDVSKAEDPAVEEEKPRKKRASPSSKSKSRKQKQPRPTIYDDDDDDDGYNAQDYDDDCQPKVTGAMDAFAKATSSKKVAADSGENGSKGKNKRRRKRLVEKTTVDPSGYLHTETQEIWEDIPTDEEDTETVLTRGKPPQQLLKKTNQQSKKLGATSSTKSGKKGPMKQGSLMGFFGKK